MRSLLSSKVLTLGALVGGLVLSACNTLDLSNAKDLADSRNITNRGDGSFDVECQDGRHEVVTHEEIINDAVCITPWRSITYTIGSPYPPCQNPATLVAPRDIQDFKVLPADFLWIERSGQMTWLCRAAKFGEAGVRLMFLEFMPYEAGPQSRFHSWGAGRLEYIAPVEVDGGYIYARNCRTGDERKVTPLCRSRRDGTELAYAPILESIVIVDETNSMQGLHASRRFSIDQYGAFFSDGGRRKKADGTTYKVNPAVPTGMTWVSSRFAGGGIDPVYSDVPWPQASMALFFDAAAMAGISEIHGQTTAGYSVTFHTRSLSDAGSRDTSKFEVVGLPANVPVSSSSGYLSRFHTLARLGSSQLILYDYDGGISPAPFPFAVYLATLDQGAKKVTFANTGLTSSGSGSDGEIKSQATGGYLLAVLPYTAGRVRVISADDTTDKLWMQVYKIADWSLQSTLEIPAGLSGDGRQRVVVDAAEEPQSILLLDRANSAWIQSKSFL